MGVISHPCPDFRLTWINWNCMDKWLHPLWNVGWNYLSIPKLQRNGSTVEVWEWLSNFIPHFIMNIITYPCRDSKLNHVSKRGPRRLSTDNQIHSQFVSSPLPATHWGDGKSQANSRCLFFKNELCARAFVSGGDVSVNPIGVLHYGAALGRACSRVKSATGTLPSAVRGLAIGASRAPRAQRCWQRGEASICLPASRWRWQCVVRWLEGTRRRSIGDRQTGNIVQSRLCLFVCVCAPWVKKFDNGIRTPWYVVH